jgi:maleate isomerase
MIVPSSNVTVETEVPALPVLSAVTAGAFCLLRSLGLSPELPDAGSLLRARSPTPVR